MDPAPESVHARVGIKPRRLAGRDADLEAFQLLGRLGGPERSPPCSTRDVCPLDDPWAHRWRRAVESVTIRGEWRSLVAHPAGGRAVAGSNPVSPIRQRARDTGLFLFRGRASGPTGVQIGVQCSFWNSRKLGDSASDVRARIWRIETLAPPRKPGASSGALPDDCVSS
jgi:hypothetical protein